MRWKIARSTSVFLILLLPCCHHLGPQWEGGEATPARPDQLEQDALAPRYEVPFDEADIVRDLVIVLALDVALLSLEFFPESGAPLPMEVVDPIASPRYPELEVVDEFDFPWNR